MSELDAIGEQVDKTLEEINRLIVLGNEIKLPAYVGIKLRKVEFDEDGHLIAQGYVWVENNLSKHDYKLITAAIDTHISTITGTPILPSDVEPIWIFQGSAADHAPGRYCYQFSRTPQKYVKHKSNKESK